ncbi:MAG: DUF4345 domain-containing protein [Deltaproteobacteria bacterium]|nr:DUF4345 domain-containing protein [Deltaproteobacteria bacterium]
MQNWVLRTAALAVGIIGFGYLLVPARVLGIYGVELHSVTETAIVRAAYGGLFVAFALLFALGSQRDALARPALIALATFMSGFGLVTKQGLLYHFASKEELVFEIPPRGGVARRRRDRRGGRRRSVGRRRAGGDHPHLRRALRARARPLPAGDAAGPGLRHPRPHRSRAARAHPSAQREALWRRRAQGARAARREAGSPEARREHSPRPAPAGVLRSPRGDRDRRDEGARREVR